MNDTRKQILIAAHLLFNERGYNGVSMADIANDVGISKGNLTYYFKKKEDIIETLVLEWHENYSPLQPPATLAQLNAALLRVQRINTYNGFYFWHYVQLGQMSARIRGIQQQVMRDKYDAYTKGFELLRQKGMLKAEAFAGQYKSAIRTLHMLCTYWLPHSRLEAQIEEPGGFLQCAWALIFPLLTEEGRLAFAAEVDVAAGGALV